MDKGSNNKSARSPGENEGGQDVQNDLHSRTGANKTQGKTQEKLERGGRKRSLSAGGEMDRAGDR
jgi:hypothetical protein